MNTLGREMNGVLLGAPEHHLGRLGHGHGRGVCAAVLAGRNRMALATLVTEHERDGDQATEHECGSEPQKKLHGWQGDSEWKPETSQHPHTA